jgi:hypothetical protein
MTHQGPINPYVYTNLAFVLADLSAMKLIFFSIEQL